MPLTMHLCIANSIRAKTRHNNHWVCHINHAQAYSDLQNSRGLRRDLFSWRYHIFMWKKMYIVFLYCTVSLQNRDKYNNLVFHAKPHDPLSNRSKYLYCSYGYSDITTDLSYINECVGRNSSNHAGQRKKSGCFYPREVLLNYKILFGRKQQTLVQPGAQAFLYCSRALHSYFLKFVWSSVKNPKILLFDYWHSFGPVLSLHCERC